MTASTQRTVTASAAPRSAPQLAHLTAYLREWVRSRVPERGDSGMISAFLVAAMACLLVIIGLGLDPGLAFAAKVDALGQAEQAARAGAQQINLTLYRTAGRLELDPAAAQTAADRFLAAERATGTVSVTGNRVTVTVAATYRTHLWVLLDIDTITVHATGTAVPHPQL
jgi:hypothetical protein